MGLYTSVVVGDELTADLDVFINQTDAIKTSDSTQFKINLAKLESKSATATIHQQEFIHYLQAYENVLDGDLEQAQAGLNRLFQEVSSLHVKVRIKATLANIQAVSREYYKALVNLDFAINNLDQVGDELLNNKINLVSSIVYYLLEIYEMSLKYSELVVNANPDSDMVCKALVYNFRSRIKLDNAFDVKRMLETINLCKHQNQIIYTSLLELDWIHKELEQAFLDENHQAIKALLSQVKTIESGVDKFGYNNLIGLKDMILAKAYYYNGDVDSAIKSARKSIEGSALSGNTSQVVDAVKLLQLEALNEKNFERAYLLGKQINEIEGEIFSEAKSKQMAYMSIKHNNLAKQLEIKQLNQSNQLLSLENKLAAETSKKQQLMMLLTISILVLLALWTYRIKKKRDYFKQVSEIDHLTQVFTRKAFEEKIKVMLNACAAENQTVNVAIMDLDHFKLVNDQYGHLVGDWVLKQVISICADVTDPNILMARLGGEEFCIVAPHITQLEMVKLMQRMRVAIEQMDCSGSGSEFNITASFGVSSTLRSGYKVSMLLTHADVALFEAKNLGRNKVVVFDEIKQQDVQSQIA